MLISQSEKLLTEVQRHYKREFINMGCKFSAIQIRPAANKDEEDSYVFSDKEYTGILTNISETCSGSKSCDNSRTENGYF